MSSEVISILQYSYHLLFLWSAACGLGHSPPQAARTPMHGRSEPLPAPRHRGTETLPLAQNWEEKKMKKWKVERSREAPPCMCLRLVLGGACF